MKKCYFLILIVSFCISSFAQTTTSTQSIKVEAGWNLMSLPVSVSDGRKSLIFQNAISEAFIYQNSYLPKDTLQNGFGFWLKFDSTETISITGETVLEDTIEVRTGWNMIGSLTVPVAVNTITSDPPGIITSQFFGYNQSGVYQETDTIQPGKGYWVKVNNNGILLADANQPPDQPSNPNPLDNVQDQLTNLTLSWTCGDPDGDTLTYDIYFGIINPPTSKIAANQTATSISRSGLLQSTTYFWRVTAKDSKGATTTGPVWRFSTAPVFTEIVSISGLDSTLGLTTGQPGYNATSLILWYNIDSYQNDAEWFYDEVLVPHNEDPPTTYYCAIGGDDFYCGIQVQSSTERRVIFAVWDNNSERATVDTAGDGVVVYRFDNEGAGMHTHWVYNWNVDSTYKFLIHILPDTTDSSRTITMFFGYNSVWKMIAKIRQPKNLSYLKYSYSFLEDWSGNDDVHRRAAYYKNQWIRKADGQWQEITSATFNVSYGDDRTVKDYGCRLGPDYSFLLVSGGGYPGYYLADYTVIKRFNNGIIPIAQLP